MAEYEIEQTEISTPEMDMEITEVEMVNPIEKLQAFIQSENIADDLDQRTLDEIGITVIDEYEEDYSSLDEWREANKEALDLAKQSREQAAISFNARAYPEVIKGDKVVKAQVVGSDPDDAKEERAVRVSDFMSWQLIEQIPNWEGDTDSLLMQLPLVGTMFREVSWDEVNQRPQITLLLPDELTINYHSKSLDLTDCRRISKEFTLYKNDIREREQMGLWLEIDYTEESTDGEYIERDEQEFIQQVRYLDLDEDGYEEPYIVTVHKSSSRVVRIVSNYDQTTIFTNDDMTKLFRIEPFKLYTDYHFIPAFDGGFYSIGFGHYLYPINKAIDSLLNQLIDSGTLHNLQSGFLGKGLRSRMGSKPMQPGEWRPVDTKGMKLSENVLPLPTKEPSTVLLNMVMFLIDIGDKMSSQTDALAGIQQGSNMPVGTTLSMIEQGLKELDAVFKRIYRALRKEYRMLYRLNDIYLDQQKYMTVLDNPEAVKEGDFRRGDFDIMPIGDASISAQYLRTMRAQAARDVVATTPGANLQEASRELLEAMGITNTDKLIPEGPSAQELLPMIEFLEGQLETYQNFVNSGQMQLMIDENNRENAQTASKVRKEGAETIKTLSEIDINLNEQQLKQYREMLNTMKLNFEQQKEMAQMNADRINENSNNSV